MGRSTFSDTCSHLHRSNKYNIQHIPNNIQHTPNNIQHIPNNTQHIPNNTQHIPISKELRLLTKLSLMMETE